MPIAAGIGESFDEVLSNPMRRHDASPQRPFAGIAGIIRILRNVEVFVISFGDALRTGAPKRSGRAVQPADLSIVNEIEAAIDASSAEKGLQTIKRVTDLFLLSAGGFDDEQIAVFDNVLDRLVKTIELRAIADVSARIALAELSSQLALITQAPPSVIRRLARNDEITIAGPVLSESGRLTPEDLVELAQTKPQPHLLAIAGRWWLKEVITDALLARQYPAVSRRVISNPGARVSAAGFAMVLAQAESDPELAVETGIRADLPADLRKKLIETATETVRSRLLSRAPSHLFEDIRSAIVAVSAGIDRQMSQTRDFAAAQRLVRTLSEKGELSEATLFGFARQRKYEETVAALAELSRSSIELIRPVMQSLRDDGILVPCKAAGLRWETVHAVLDSRFVTGKTGPQDLTRAQAQYRKLTTEEAQRLLRFWQVRPS